MRKLKMLALMVLVCVSVWGQEEDLSITKRWYTHNNGSIHAGKWTKIAECTVISAWQDFGTTFEFIGNGGSGFTMYYGKIVARFKNQNSTPQQPNAWNLTLVDSNLGKDNVKAIFSGLLVELFVRIPAGHTRIYYKALVNGSSSMTPLMTQSFIDELPVGDKVIACSSSEESDIKSLNLTNIKVTNEINAGESTASKIQLATSGWSGSHGILFNAYKDNYQNGWLAKNTRYFNNKGNYSSGAGGVFFYGNGGTMDFCISPNSTGKDNPVEWGDPKLRIYRNGNVAIGKPSADYKLDVAGTIRAEEILVEAKDNTADFVFEPDYQLKSLSDVESFINTNKHLPDIPSASQMEEQGVNLAEMNKLLLQKVEELTLYSIDLEKARKKADEARNKEQGERETLEKKVSSMETELQAIKEMIQLKLNN